MAAPVGNVPVRPQHTLPTFGVFVVERDRSGLPPAPTPPPPTPSSADLGVAAHQSDRTGTVGNPLTFRFAASNLGPASASTTLTTSVPAGTALISAATSQGTCSGATAISCSLGVLGAGRAATVTVVVRPLAAATLSASAKVASGIADPVAANNIAAASAVVSAVTSPAGADLALTAAATPNPVRQGSRVTFSYTVQNRSTTVSALDVVLRTSVPSGMTWVSSAASRGGCTGQPAVTCTLGSLTPGKTATVIIVATAGAAGTRSHISSVSSGAADPSMGNNSATTSLTIVP
jgi:uncharacterized repeat protein (TIGR01451 family)